MNASSITRRTLTYANVRKWAWWQLPVRIRAYVGAVVLAGLGFTIYAATQTTWHADDGWKFALLLTSALVSVAATPRSTYQQGAITRDFITVWVVPLAVLLPPVYAMVVPAPLYILTILRVHRGAIH